MKLPIFIKEKDISVSLDNSAKKLNYSQPSAYTKEST